MYLPIYYNNIIDVQLYKTNLMNAHLMTMVKNFRKKLKPIKELIQKLYHRNLYFFG